MNPSAMTSPGRYRLLEPATLVCMAVLLWPFLEFDLRLLTYVFGDLTPRASFVTPAAVAVMRAGSVGLMCFQIGIAYLAAFALCSKIHRDTVKLSIRQIHLSTGLVLMLTASVLVGLVLAGKPAVFYSADPNPLAVSIALTHCLVPALAVLMGVTLACEARIAAKYPPFSPTPDAAPPRAGFTPEWFRGEPTTQDRIVFALPLLALFLLVLIGPILVDTLQLKTLRLDFPILIRQVVYYTDHGHGQLAPALLILGGIYVAWISRSRRRMLIFAVLVTAVLLLGVFALLLTLITPMIAHDFPCVVEGEPIDTPDGPRPIETLKTGDAVFCRNPAGETVPGVITAVQINTVHVYLELNFDCGSRLSVTAHHPLATLSGYRRAGTLVIGDTVIAREGPRTIHAITVVERTVKVYDLTVSPHPNFFASGVLVHNKMRKK